MCAVVCTSKKREWCVVCVCVCVWRKRERERERERVGKGGGEDEEERREDECVRGGCGGSRSAFLCCRRSRGGAYT